MTPPKQGWCATGMAFWQPYLYPSNLPPTYHRLICTQLISVPGEGLRENAIEEVMGSGIEMKQGLVLKKANVYPLSLYSECPGFLVFTGFQWLLKLSNLWKLKCSITDVMPFVWKKSGLNLCVCHYPDKIGA
jgi:hypothetical protein